MKKILGVLSFILLFCFVTLKSGWSAEPCEGFQNKILVLFDSTVENSLKDYTNAKYKSPAGDAIWLCFVYETSIPSIKKPLVLNNSSGLPVFISGLSLRADTMLRNSTLFTLGGINSVVLTNSSIQCSGKGTGSTGVKLVNDNHRVLASTITHCDIGLQIGDTQTPGNNIQVEKVTAHDNGIAFKVANGERNFFKYDSVFDNDNNGDGTFSAQEGIEGVLSPLVLDAERCGLKCEANCDEADSLPYQTSIKFKTRYSQGTAELSLTRKDEVPQREQGKTFLVEGSCGFSPVSARGDYTASCRLDIPKGLEDQFGVLLFHGSQEGSSSYSLPFSIKPCVGIASAAELDAPGIGGITGGQVIGDPSLPPPAPAEDKKKAEDSGGSGIGVSTPSGDAPAQVIGGGIGATGAPGGIQAPKCSLTRYQDFSTQTFFAFLSLVLAFGALVVMRSKSHLQ